MYGVGLADELIYRHETQVSLLYRFHLTEGHLSELNKLDHKMS